MSKLKNKWLKAIHNKCFFVILVLIMVAQFVMVSITFFNSQKMLAELDKRSDTLEIRVKETRTSLEALKRHYYQINRDLKKIVN